MTLVLPPAIQQNLLAPAPIVWDPVFYIDPRKPSAVLLLFVEPESASREPSSLVMIRRSTRVGSHRGQIGFPGGRLENGDRSPVDTALREANEELGVEPDKVSIRGGLRPLPALDGSFVFPIVGLISQRDCILKPDPVEVQSVHQVNWPLIGRGNLRKFSFNMFGCWRDSFLYDCGAISIWGLSAEILAQGDF